MTETPIERSRRFLALHHGAGPLLMPNPWDLGTARLLVSLVREVDRPVNVLPRPGTPTVAELAAFGD
jgi:hypothetical protein